MDNQRNIILAIVLCGVLLLGWDFVVGRIYPAPPPTEQADAPAAGAASDAPVRHTREGGLTDPDAIAEEARDLVTALKTPGRVAIDAPDIAGSINPVGARIDDISLKDHRQTIEKDFGPVRLFSPAGTPAQQFAQFGWAGEGVKVPDARTVWQVEGDKLTPDTPVTLTWNNGAGQRFTIRFSIDDKYLVTAEQTVANLGVEGASGPIVVRPYAVLNRTSRTASQDTWNVHSGPIGAFDEAVDFGWNYDDVAEARTVEMKGRPDWIGFTDIYWLAALVAQDGANPDASFRALGGDVFRADLIYQPLTIANGRQITRQTQLFVGAKESSVLADYESAGIANFSRTIDWGWFEIIEKPILWLLKHLFALVGNFGVAIMLLTVVIRGLMFPIAQKQFASMAQMRAVQPKMKALQERFKDDRVQLQQEMAKLYKAEGVNPLAGCLPLLLQIPIFFALYKVLLLSIEMRHQPFALWIRDLSVPDPAHLLNLFGMLPFDVPGFLAIGPLALLLGVTMFLQFKLNPAQMDPVQQQIFMIMPWVMMFVMAPFAAGLLLYWCTSNVLTIAQQWYLYSKHPQLKAQADKDKVDAERARARDAKGVMSDTEERARKLFSGRVEFLLSAPQLKFLPEPTAPEIAFCGRSNVGKSSLLNALTGRKALARTSVTPGRTQELNFFEVGEPTLFRLVDMPGYGFAKAPPKVVEAWKRLVRDYLRGRAVLKRALVLVDARHGLKDVDREMLALLDEAAVTYRVVLTKADKLKASELAQVAAATEAEVKKHVAAFPELHVTSSEKKMGIDELRAAVLADAEG